MTSAVSLCNLALTRIGAQTINDLNEASSAARHCSALYAPTRDALLQSQAWRFARARQVLAELQLEMGERPSEWAHVYALPVDCLTPLYIEPSGRAVMAGRGAQSLWPDETGTLPVTLRPAQATPDFEVRAGRRILSDQPEATLIYTARIEDPTRFDPLFVEALSWRLAADLASALKGDPRRRQEALREALTVTNAARAADAAAATIRDDYDAAWIRAR
ncbi:hypothetical protein [Algihabitans sp.]|uniref:hypothetical protein n=1 Tax=Algihabitans sp. TaxID=2821514 RepID=UPI003BA8E629